MNIVCIGAHPDDCEVHAGGTGVKWAQLGHRVVFVSMTNGDIGHHEMGGGELARRRARESQVSAERGGMESLTLDYHDGELEPTLEARREVVRTIRRYQADIVLTHRPNDYHPDHRYTSVLVQDAAFMVTVPNFCPATPCLERNPTFLYQADPFSNPAFLPDVAVDVTDVMPVKWDMLDAMESQSYEWLPWLEGTLDQVPKSPDERRRWLEGAWAHYLGEHTRLARPALEKWYGPDAADSIAFAEPFQICEYGHRPSDKELEQLFPFLPSSQHG